MQFQNTAQYALKIYGIFSYSSKSPNSFNNFFWYSGSDADLLTLPTAKAGGFLLLPLLHWQTPYGTTMSYTVSTSYIYTVPVCPTVQFLSLCRLHLQSFFLFFDTCIRIPVMNRMAFGTLPDTHAQLFYPIRRKTPCFTYGDIRRVHRIYASN